MSFILDALRKAEHKNRDQHTMTVPRGPRVLNDELPEAPPAERNSAAVLILMGAVLASALWWFMKPEPTATVTPSARSTAPQQITPARQPAAQSTRTQPSQSQTTATNAETVPGGVRRDTGARALDREALRGDITPAPDRANSASAGSNVARTSTAAPATGRAGTQTTASRPVTPGTVRILNADGSVPDDVVTPGRVEQETLPDYAQSVSTGQVPIPELHLDIHVYSAEPAKRFVFINLDKYGEGDAIDKDTQVESIEPEGAVINHKGYRFVLRPD